MQAESVIPIAFLFGVEIETVVKLSGAEDEHIKQLYGGEDWRDARGSVYLFLIDLLANHGIPVDGSRPLAGTSRVWTGPSDVWSFKYDPSIVECEDGDSRYDPGYSYLAVEIVSRVLPATDEGFHEVVKVMDLIKSKYQLIDNTTCGLHVHVGASREDKKWPLGTLKRFAQLILAFDHQINSLHPDWRISGNKYCVQNSESEFLQQSDPFLRGKAIELCSEDDSEGELVRMMNPNYNRQAAYNFTNLSSVMNPRTTRRTIEWRQHEGTSDGRRIRAWCEFATGLVRYAHEAPPVEQLDLWSKSALNDRFTILELLKTIGLDHLADFYSDKIFERPRPRYRPTQYNQAMTLEDLQDQLHEEQLIALEEGQGRSSIGPHPNLSEGQERGRSSYAELPAASRPLSSSPGPDGRTHPQRRSRTVRFNAIVSYHYPKAREDLENVEALDLYRAEDSDDDSDDSRFGSNVSDIDSDDSSETIHIKLNLMEYRIMEPRRPVLQKTRLEDSEFEDIDLSEEPQESRHIQSTKGAKPLSPEESEKRERISQWIDQL